MIDLLNLPVVQVMICVIISWGLFCIFISLVQEAIAQVMAERGRFMKTYLEKQLKDESNGINWGSLVYQHGAVDLLTRATNKPTNDINPSVFAEVLVDVIGKSQVVQAAKSDQKDPGSALSNFKTAMQTLKPGELVSFLRLALGNAEAKAAADPTGSKDPAVYRELIAEVESWYKEFEERLSLWYKKRMRLKLFVMGLLLSVIINVDSIQLFNFYRVSPKARTAVVNYYNTYVADSTRKAADSTVHREIKADQVSIVKLDSLVQVADLPVGFDYSVFKAHPKSGWAYWWKLIGCLITGFAASFGAPFWFDLLKKIYKKNT